MNNFDLSILTFLNGFVNLNPHLDALITAIHQNNLVSNGLMVAIWWYCWFQFAPEQQHRPVVREKLLAGLVAVLGALLIAQLIAHIPPLRIRPFLNPELHFVIPNWDGTPPPLKNWSAFPSDHAVLWFALAATTYLASKPIGWFAIAYAALLSLCRVYSGYHHPTDILAGAALGVVVVLACNTGVTRKHLSQSGLRLSERSPGLFYAVIFLLTYEISNTFNEARAIAALCLHATKLFP